MNKIARTLSGPPLAQTFKARPFSAWADFGPSRPLSLALSCNKPAAEAKQSASQSNFRASTHPVSPQAHLSTCFFNENSSLLFSYSSKNLHLRTLTVPRREQRRSVWRLWDTVTGRDAQLSVRDHSVSFGRLVIHQWSVVWCVLGNFNNNVQKSTYPF